MSLRTASLLKPPITTDLLASVYYDVISYLFQIQQFKILNLLKLLNFKFWTIL